MEGRRLDELQRGVWDAAFGGDLDAIKAVLGIMGRRAKLFGLDAPTTVPVGGISEAEFAHQVAELLTVIGGPGAARAAPLLASDLCADPERPVVHSGPLFDVAMLQPCGAVVGQGDCLRFALGVPCCWPAPLALSISRRSSASQPSAASLTGYVVSAVCRRMSGPT